MIDPHAPEVSGPCDICTDKGHDVLANLRPVFNFGPVNAHRICFEEWYTSIDPKAEVSQ